MWPTRGAVWGLSRLREYCWGPPGIHFPHPLVRATPSGSGLAQVTFCWSGGRMPGGDQLNANAQAFGGGGNCPYCEAVWSPQLRSTWWSSVPVWGSVPGPGLGSWDPGGAVPLLGFWRGLASVTRFKICITSPCVRVNVWSVCVYLYFTFNTSYVIYLLTFQKLSNAGSNLWPNKNNLTFNLNLGSLSPKSFYFLFFIKPGFVFRGGRRTSFGSMSQFSRAILHEWIPKSSEMTFRSPHIF